MPEVSGMGAVKVNAQNTTLFFLAFVMRWIGTCLAPLVLLLDFQLLGLLQYPHQCNK